MSAPALSHGSTCDICRQVPTGDLMELDIIMGDAAYWPSTVWGAFKPPKGRMTPARQRFGAVEMGRKWLTEHGFEFSDRIIRNHYRYDVVVVAASLEDLVNRGLIEQDPRKGSSAMTTTADRIDPGAFLQYFDRGIKLGNRSLELLATRLEEQVNKGEAVPIATLMKMAELGAKLATTQATIKARSLPWGDDSDAEEGFRVGSMPEPSQRVGHHRIRVIDGEARPVKDEGPADREHYSARAREEGGEGLPHR